MNRILSRTTTVLMDALEHGNTVDETDEAVLRLGLPMAPSVLLQMVGPRVANHVLHTLHDAYPDRYPLSPTLDNFAEGRDEIVVIEHTPKTVEEIHVAVLEAVADEVRHILDEGVVQEAADIDACLILGRRLSVLARRHHQAPRSDGDLAARRGSTPRRARHDDRLTVSGAGT